MSALNFLGIVVAYSFVATIVYGLIVRRGESDPDNTVIIGAMWPVTLPMLFALWLTKRKSSTVKAKVIK